jgi:hypothetical protein
MTRRGFAQMHADTEKGVTCGLLIAAGDFGLRLRNSAVFRLAEIENRS